MKDGRWLTPRYTDKAVFEKDFPHIDFNPIELYCPGCRAATPLSRRSTAGKLAGWCKACSRPICA